MHKNSGNQELAAQFLTTIIFSLWCCCFGLPCTTQLNKKKHPKLLEILWFYEPFKKVSNCINRMCI